MPSGSYHNMILMKKRGNRKDKIRRSESGVWRADLMWSAFVSHPIRVPAAIEIGSFGARPNEGGKERSNADQTDFY
jgi:hypothetical protein